MDMVMTLPAAYAEDLLNEDGQRRVALTASYCPICNKVRQQREVDIEERIILPCVRQSADLSSGVL